MRGESSRSQDQVQLPKINLLYTDKDLHTSHHKRNVESIIHAHSGTGSGATVSSMYSNTLNIIILACCCPGWS